MTTTTPTLSTIKPEIVVIEKAGESGHTINAMARCDSCGAQARNIAVRDNLSLYFCNHHEREHEDGLLRAGFSIEKHSYMH